MNTGGDAADQMVRDGMVILETSAKLGALAAKDLVAVAAALARDNPKLRGKTRLNRLLKEGKELKVFPIKADDSKEFHTHAKRYGVLYTAVKEKQDAGELVYIMAKAEDVSKLNRIFESMGYALPKEQAATRKKESARDPSNSDLTMQRAGAVKANQTLTTDKPSVREKVDGLAAKAQEAQKRLREKIKAKERE